MAKPILQKKPSICWRLCISAAASLVILIPILTLADPWLRFSSRIESKGPTFYDDPETVYTTDKAESEWDEKRDEWLKVHPQFSKSENRVFVITGSQPSPCSNPSGDHLLLRFFKNKVDYCRIHSYGILYNNAFLQPEMRSYWAKIPVIRAAMVAHPEAEWLFWVDSDAIFTDMEFAVPLERYKDHNLVVHGWPDMIYEKKSWVSLNAGVFLIRNCGWSMEFLEAWGGMGPKSPRFKRWGEMQRATLKDKMFPDSDDQSALVYLMLKGKRRWRERIYVENEYALHGYWIGIVGRFEELGRREGRRRRHAEVDVEVAVKERRPFVTHFTGCQPCSGEHNPAYEGDSCRVGMERALNFADNQVLTNYGFVHPDLGNASLVTPLPFY
ncbi:glycosyltransferase 6-like [Salvia miltiorrhiza]|uniref:glycosyltransferase 6-like n=1 Tax=Salvia miltiorrhiza TaxID=226208 RepID=UPI0025AB97B4|nr:glycosyltransferase 6-like [Salvia miltiorrhiza]